MKTLVFAILVSLGSLMHAQDGVTITVVINGLANDNGEVGLSLWNEATFMKAAPLDTVKKAPENKAVTLVFENVTPGEYGIIALHDLNNNGRMDFENGMPTEAYGLSGGDLTMGPPTWDAAKFEVGEEDITLEIKM